MADTAPPEIETPGDRPTTPEGSKDLRGAEFYSPTSPSQVRTLESPCRKAGLVTCAFTNSRRRARGGDHCHWPAQDYNANSFWKPDIRADFDFPTPPADEPASTAFDLAAYCVRPSKIIFVVRAWRCNCARPSRQHSAAEPCFLFAARARGCVHARCSCVLVCAWRCVCA